MTTYDNVDPKAMTRLMLIQSVVELRAEVERLRKIEESLLQQKEVKQ